MADHAWGVSVGQKLYVVTEIGAEYDDSYYYLDSDGNGTPVKAYRRAQSAANDARRRNENELREKMIDGLSEWIPNRDVYEFVTEGPLFDDMLKLFDEYGVRLPERSDFTGFEYDENVSAETLPRAFFRRLYELCNLSWYTVTAVDYI